MIRHSRCSRVAVHLDVGSVDANEGLLGLGKVAGGLTGIQGNRIAHDGPGPLRRRVAAACFTAATAVGPVLSRAALRPARP
ncbi:hypothetical protein E1265_05995 [Streptomyces sp. 8K308]|uniref:hypothetical protein n=1 Tax=Streptomyces sp. 8K308 TaxID=2530388 RepID=UPI00104CC1DC|nr:hypothetical protein [Streptomyces sp. 8K308]TDC25817.1 hypothetical protein E1265_05995 [Streptomyces sp. 8K308]